MHAGKPDFFYFLLSAIGHTKQVLAKERSALINGNCMANDLQVGILRGRREWETNSVVDPTHRAHRIPNPDEMRFTLPRERLFKIGSNSEVDLFLFNHSDCIGD